MRQNNQGFTLLESMVAVFVLAVGILAAAGMQLQAIYINNNSMVRTRANVIARSLVEEFHRLPFNDPSVFQDVGTIGLGGLNTGSNIGNGTVEAASADNLFVAANLPNLAGLYTVGQEGAITDSDGQVYRIFWNVANAPQVGGRIPFRTVRLFVYWQTPPMMGVQKFLQYTMVKQNNN